MKQFIILIAAFALYSCSNKQEQGKFTITGDIKNVPDQKVFLEQLYFSEKNPEVVDTADMKSGKFTLSAIAPEEGLYRARLEKNNGGFIFINDAKDISFNADLKNPNLDAPDF